MLDYLLCLSSLMIILAYIGYLFLFFSNNKKILDNDSCCGVFSDILSEYDGINIILSKGIFSYYDIQRRIIKLNEKCYYGDTINYLSIALIEMGYFINDKLGNKFINICRKIIPTLKIFYILPILSIIISNSIYSTNDSVLGIMLIFIFVYISFLNINIKRETYNWIMENNKIKKYDNVDMIINLINKIIILEWFIIFGELIMIIRLLLMMSL